ncbi:hypothetical protein MRX96_025402 [Rhipicephalus microplus]
MGSCGVSAHSLEDFVQCLLKLLNFHDDFSFCFLALTNSCLSSLFSFSMFSILTARPGSAGAQGRPESWCPCVESAFVPVTMSRQQHAPTGYEAAALRYRPTTSPVYGGPPQHTLQHQTTTPYLVNPRGSWTPFAGTTTTQATGPADAAASAAAGLTGRAGSSSSAAASAESGLHASLGADEVTSAGEFSRGATGEASAGDMMSGVTRVANMGQLQHMVGPLDNVPYYMPFNGRENHNEKERKRRTRIKNACQTLRTLVPGLSDKTDKATVFEFTVQYLLHLRRHLGTKHDKPQQVHLSYGANEYERMVTWVTFDRTGTPTVEYGPSGFYYVARGSTTRFLDGGKKKRVLYIHRVLLKNLQANTEYMYHCGSSGCMERSVHVPSGSVGQQQRHDCCFRRPRQRERSLIASVAAGSSDEEN